MHSLVLQPVIFSSLFCQAFLNCFFVFLFFNQAYSLRFLEEGHKVLNFLRKEQTPFVQQIVPLLTSSLFQVVS